MGASTDETEGSVDLPVTCQAAQLRFIEETFPSVLISETVNLTNTGNPPRDLNKTAPTIEQETGIRLDEILRLDFQGSIFSAIQDQLGLKLESARGPGESLVIESANKPTPN
jgi:uncharacterized protein (TIGR03435 family)